MFAVFGKAIEDGFHCHLERETSLPVVCFQTETHGDDRDVSLYLWFSEEGIIMKFANVCFVFYKPALSPSLLRFHRLPDKILFSIKLLQ